MDIDDSVVEGNNLPSLIILVPSLPWETFML
jgi:hypothetical protein